MSLILTWSRECGISSMERRVITNTRRDTSPTNATFKTTDTKLYVPVVTLSTENDQRLLEQLRTGFKRTIRWNKCRSEMTNQTKNNNLIVWLNPHLLKSIDSLSYYLKMKTMEHYVLCTKCPNRRL